MEFIKISTYAKQIYMFYKLFTYIKRFMKKPRLML
jgi:hypothetical protein